jgi:putative ABC transport system ATP-binding protein
MDQTAITCRGIKKSYGEGETRIDALKGISLDIYPGQLTLLVGPSGSGKSTLLSIITTILTPDEGQLFLLGEEVNKMEDSERAKFCLENLGIVFQSLFLIPTLTVAENVSLPLLIAGYTEEAAANKSKELLSRMNIANRSEISPYDLSKGQQQRVAIARAMVNNSKIIVCDEPTSSLDQASGSNVMNLLHEVARESSRAVLVVTHDHRIFSHADRIIEMNDGQIVSEEKNE